VADFLAWMDLVPPVVVYVTLGLGAALENIVPAVPADTFVALGGLLSTLGDLDVRWIFVATWSLNTASAMLMYRVGWIHGRPFFERGWGQRVLKPHQMDRMVRFYDRWGTWAIFLTRFLPGLRAVVPIFAGVTQQRPLFVVAPIASASAIWYGALIWIGVATGHNLDTLRAVLSRTSGILAAVAAVVFFFAARWWWRTRWTADE